MMINKSWLAWLLVLILPNSLIAADTQREYISSPERANSPEAINSPESIKGPEPIKGPELNSTLANSCIILLHGLGRSDLSMKAVQWHLAKAGATVVSNSYPSTEYPIETLAQLAIEPALRNCRAQQSSSIHFVTHSLGGILLRQYLSTQSIDELGRVVMLGPPNQGSQLADYIDSIAQLSRWQPLAAKQLGTGKDSLPVQLGPVDFELGVIAGTRNVRPLLTHTLTAASDGTVLVTETQVAGMSDFITLPVSHTFIMWNAAVLDQIAHFLNHGRFAVPS